MDLGAIWDQTREQLETAYGDIVGFVIATVEAILVVLVAVAVSRWLRGRTRRSRAVARLGPNLTTLIGNAVGVGVYVLAATFVLGLFGASWTALLAVLSVGTVAISLALQDVLRNAVAGVYVLVERPFSIGDRVRVRDIEGEVEGIELRTTVIRNAKQERVLVPNAVVFSEILTNRSVYKTRQTSLRLEGIQASVEGAEATVRLALAGLPGLREPAPRLVVQKVSSEGATVEVEIWHEAAIQIEGLAIARLRQCFPEATVATGAA